MRACPGELDLEALASGGQASRAVRRHVARCAACRDRLEHVRANDRFLARAAADLANAMDGRANAAPAPAAPLPVGIPGYRIVEEISRGGQGVVYRAVQTETKRPAAVKMLLAGAFATSRQLHRFERETELAAGLRHPNIVTIFGSGVAADGGRFVAMEFVRGVPLDRFVADTLGPARPGSRARVDAVVRLAVQVARGVAHAHAAGVVHRDIKPGNILVDDQGLPRVLDFGLARSSAEPGDAAPTQDFAGTPAYAAPERLNGAPGQADARSDVYALGMVLYRLLTDHAPYPCDGPIAVVARHAAQTPPTPPRRYVPRLPTDVQTIVLRCLAKDPGRRYANAGELASDIDDHLNGYPISARRDSPAYVLGKLLLRHRSPAAAAGVVALTVVLAAIGFALLAADLDRSRRVAEAALSDSNIQRARLMAAGGDAERAETILWAEASRARLDTGAELCVAGSAEQLRSAWSLAEFYARFPRAMRARTDSRCDAVGFSRDQASVWALDASASRLEWSLDGRLLHRSAPLRASGAAPPAYSAITSANGRYAAVVEGATTVVWDLVTGDRVGRVEYASPPMGIVLVGNDGATIATLYDPQPGWCTVRDATGASPPAQFDDDVLSFSLHDTPDGSQALLVGTLGGPGRSVIIRRPPLWEPTMTIPLGVEAHEDPTSPVRGVTLSPDATLLAATLDSTVLLYDIASTPSLVAEFQTYTKEVDRLVFDPGGRSLQLVDRSGVLIRLGVPDLEPLHTIATSQRATGIALAPTGNLVAVAQAGSGVAVYETSDRPWLTRSPSTDVTHASIACGPDGALAWGDDNGALHILPPGAPNALPAVPAHDGVITSVAFSADGASILTAGFDGRVVAWDRQGRDPRVIGSGMPRIWSARFSPDGAWIAAGLSDGTVRLWANRPGAAGRVIQTEASRVPMVRFSPDGSRLLCAAVSLGQHALMLDVASGREVHRFASDHEFIRAVAWSPDGSKVATTADDRIVRIWNSDTGEPVTTIPGLPWGPYAMRFDPRGRVLFVAGPGGSIIVVDPQAGAELAKLAVHDRPVFSIDLSPDGDRLFSSGEDPWVGVCDLGRLRQYIRGNEDYWRSAATTAK